MAWFPGICRQSHLIGVKIFSFSKIIASILHVSFRLQKLNVVCRQCIGYAVHHSWTWVESANVHGLLFNRPLKLGREKKEIAANSGLLRVTHSFLRWKFFCYISFFFSSWLSGASFSKAMTITGKNLLRATILRRSFSSTSATRLYIQNNLHNDQSHPRIQVDPNAKIYDFRSDTVTAPTDEMFDVMKMASRGDDVFEVW